MSKFAFLALASAIALSSAPAQAAGFNLTDVIRASPADLNAALADAQAQNDTFAVQCYTGTIAYNAANPQQSLTGNIQGVVSGFQVARDIVKAGQSGASGLIPKELISACGPLALDVENDIGHASFMLFGVKLF